jgi:hypothetical protein
MIMSMNHDLLIDLAVPIHVLQDAQLVAYCRCARRDESARALN